MAMTDFSTKQLAIDPKWLTGGQIEQMGGNGFPLRFSQAEKRVLKKKKKIQPSVWAERHRRLPTDAAVPGRWKNSTVPYAAGILDASFFPSIQKVVVCAAPQTGKTDINYTCLGYPSLTLHSLRHTFASLKAGEGRSLKEVQEL